MSEPIVLLPGLQSSRASWINQIRYFEDRYEVIVPTGYHEMTSIDEMADCILAQVPERFHFVAWSMGGYIALALIPRLKERLQSLVLMSTSAQPENPESTKRRLESLSTAEAEGIAAAHEKSLLFSVLDYDGLPHEVAAGLKQTATDLGIEAYRNQQNAIIHRADGRDNLPQISCPTLIVVGDHDKVTPPAYAREMHALLKGSELVEIPGCGHCPPLEFPDRVNGLLEGWFRRHAAKDALTA